MDQFSFITDNHKTLFSFVGSHSNNFCGCCECNGIWPKEGFLNHEEVYEAASRFNGIISFIENDTERKEFFGQLKLYGIFFREMCFDCLSKHASLVSTIRQEQLSQGFDPCFLSKKCDKYCSDCKYADVCAYGKKITAPSFTFINASAEIHSSVQMH